MEFLSSVGDHNQFIMGHKNWREVGIPTGSRSLPSLQGRVGTSCQVVQILIFGSLIFDGRFGSPCCLPMGSTFLYLCCAHLLVLFVLCSLPHAICVVLACSLCLRFARLLMLFVLCSFACSVCVVLACLCCLHTRVATW